MHSQRWRILGCAAIIALTNDFLYDQPAVLVQRLTGNVKPCHDGTDKCLNLTVLHFNTLYTISTFCGAFGSLFAGYLADRIGATKLTCISSTFLPIGALFIALSPYSTAKYQYAVIAIGRTFVGLGDGMLITLAHRIKGSWFAYSEIGMSFAAHQVMSRLGTGSNFLIIGGIVPYIGLTGCLWIGFAVGLIECLTALYMSYVNCKYPEVESWRADIHVPGSIVHESKLAWKTLKEQPKSLWLIVVGTFFSAGTIYTYTSNAPNMMAYRYWFKETRASIVAGLTYDVQIIMAPLVGYFTDRYGHRDLWLVSAGWLTLTGMISAFSETFPPGAYSTIIGIGDSIYGVAAYAGVVCIVGPNSVGLAFGLMKLMDGLGTGTCTAAIGGILINSPGSNRGAWFGFFVFLTVTALISTLLYIALDFVNHTSGRGLSWSQSERSFRRSSAIPILSQKEYSETAPLLMGFGRRATRSDEGFGEELELKSL